LAIGLGGIPENLSFEFLEFTDQQDEITDSYFPAGSDIHCLTLIIFFACRENPLSTIFGIKNFAGGISRAAFLKCLMVILKVDQGLGYPHFGNLAGTPFD
jgi:hypothetical protein